MSFLCLGSIKGSHLIINTEKYNNRLLEYSSSEDGFIHVVGGVVKDVDGRIYLHHNAKLNEFMLPGGKVELGEKFEDALKRELQEELSIDVKESHCISSIKYILGGLKRCFHMFIVDQYVGVPLNNENDKFDQYWAEIIDSDNILGFAVKIDGTITDDAQDIMHSFIDIYHLISVVPKVNDNILLSSVYNNYDISIINPSQHYYLYCDLIKKEYYFEL